MQTETTTKHTAEPWSVTEKADRSLMITAPAGWYIARITASTAVGKEREVPKANAARIVQCVNECAGMEDPARSLADVRAFLREIVDATTTSDGKRSSHGHQAAGILRALGG